VTERRGRALPDAADPGSGLAYRPGRSDDLDRCTRIWKAGIEDYQLRLNQPPMPDDLGPLRRILAHLLETDPERFWVATRDGDAIGFASASVREDLWFLAMLFVEPREQAAGVGRGLMDRAQAGREVVAGEVVPGPDDPLRTGIGRWGMCTDSAQPISNGLYARRGMIPRVPIWRLVGEVRRRSALPAPPASLEVVAFESLAATEPDGERRLQATLDELDRMVVGSAHPADHGFLRRDGRVGFALRERSGARRVTGYAYGSGVGRLGPVAALEPDLLPALLGVAIRETPALGTVAAWVPASAEPAVRALLDAGLRFEAFPGLICWSAAEHPFDRYLPISLAMV